MDQQQSYTEMNDTIVPLNNGSDFERMPERNVDGVTIHFDVGLGESVGRKLLVVGGGMGRGKTAMIHHIGLGSMFAHKLIPEMDKLRMRDSEMLVVKSLDDVIERDRGLTINEEHVKTIIPIHAAPKLDTLYDYFDKPTCSPREWGQKKKKRKKK